MAVSKEESSSAKSRSASNGVHYLAKCVLRRSVVLQVVQIHVRSPSSNDVNGGLRGSFQVSSSILIWNQTAVKGEDYKLIYFQEAIIFPISRGSFGPCTDELRGVINIAENERRMQCQCFISIQHILFGLSFSRVGDNVRMLNDGSRCSGGLHSKLSMFSIYKLSRTAADRLGDKGIGLEHLVLAIFFRKQKDDPIKRVELEYGSSLFFDNNAFDPELVDCEKQRLHLFFGESILHNGYITIVYTSPAQTYEDGFHTLVR